jgi:hypothetical protein
MNAPETSPPHQSQKLTLELSSVVIPLLKGVLYQEDQPGLWATQIGRAHV